MNTVAAGHGWTWVLTGFALFRKNPAMWAFLVFSYIMLMQVLGMGPALGWFAATVLIPAFSASFMIRSALRRSNDRRAQSRAGPACNGFRRLKWPA